MNPAFWKGRRVFLTGHTGFKGAWLSLWLQQLGAVVHGYALAPQDDDTMFDVASVANGMTHQLGDVKDGPLLRKGLADFAPDIVIHIAAQSLVRRSYADPLETFEVNVMGTAHLLDAVRHAGAVAATLIVTSDKCYENDESGHAFSEGDPMGGSDPYSSSKGCAELVTSAYGRSFSGALGPVVSVRAGNVIGGGDWAEDRILPDTFRALIAGKDIEVRNPKAIRPWQHVLEPLAGYLAAAEYMANDLGGARQAWNFGPNSGDEAPVAYVAGRCCALWGRSEALQIAPQAGAPPEAGILRLDSTKAQRELGWKPRWTLDETLLRTVDWYRAYAAGANMRDVTIAQIADYQRS